MLSMFMYLNVEYGDFKFLSIHFNHIIFCIYIFIFISQMQSSNFSISSRISNNMNIQINFSLYLLFCFHFLNYLVFGCSKRLKAIKSKNCYLIVINNYRYINNDDVDVVFLFILFLCVCFG